MRYCPYFCEENVWHLCSDDVVDAPVAARSAVFISNRARSVAMEHQRAGHGGVVAWDYHVVLLARGAVWDLDCTKGAPLSLAVWHSASFPREAPAVMRPRFRVVDATTFIATFASDRSHMVGSGHAPPPWPPIGDGMNLMRFVDVDDAAIAGDVIDSAELLRRFAT